MLKRAGVLAFVLTAGALLQPVAASAQERFDHGRDRAVEVRRDHPRFTREYVEPRYGQRYREGYGQEYFEPSYRREYVVPAWRDDYRHERFVRRDDRWYGR